jgi:ferrous iron transport protein B
MRVALIGQPNCGKSTLFNSVVGYRSETSNLAGTTVQASVGRARLNCDTLELVDLPGIYSLVASTPAEATTREWLLESRPDLVINVHDASLLSRTLELTLELCELGIPMVVCLNMMDEARRKGIEIDTKKLAEALKLPVVACVATQGKGLDQLFEDVKHAAPPKVSAVRESAADDAIHAARHDRAMRIFEQVATVGRPRPDIRARIDEWLTHPLLGYVFLLGTLLLFFWAVFGLGSALERTVQRGLSLLFAPVEAHLAAGSLMQAIVTSAWGGLVGGAGIVLPYLVPFLIGLALLEDTGYLPRVAYLTDGLLHRIGLHGSAVLPLLLGYGCTVPACLATRVLPARRDRFLASILAMLVPCSARSNVILAVVGFYLGPLWALAIFAMNAAVVIVSGWLLTRLWPEVTPGMILDVPQYQAPQIKVVARKVWLRTRDFIFLSWPLLIGGSIVLGLATRFGWDRWINLGLRPLTALLGLPAAVGVTLIFGVLRKELSLVMLMQAMGTMNLGRALTVTQLVTFTVFVVFYTPCLATLATMAGNLGKKLTAAAAAYSLAIAIALAVGGRILLAAVLP